MATLSRRAYPTCYVNGASTLHLPNKNSALQASEYTRLIYSVVALEPPDPAVLTSTHGSLADQMPSTMINPHQQVASMGLPLSFDCQTVELSLLGGFGTLGTGHARGHRSITFSEDFLNSLLHSRAECPTVITTPAIVRMAVDKQPEVRTALATIGPISRWSEHSLRTTSCPPFPLVLPKLGTIAPRSLSPFPSTPQDIQRP